MCRLNMQERLQLLCQWIDKNYDKSGQRMTAGKVLRCKSAEVKTKVAEVMGIMLDNRLEFEEECYSQCGELLLLVCPKKIF